MSLFPNKLLDFNYTTVLHQPPNCFIKKIYCGLVRLILFIVMLILGYRLIVFSLIGVFDNGFDVSTLNFGRFISCGPAAADSRARLFPGLATLCLAHM